MQTITLLSQLILGIGCLLAALAASFRIQKLKSVAPIFAQAGFWRIAQAAIQWIALLVTVIGIMVPFAAFFGSCIVFIFSLPLAFRAAYLKGTRNWALPAVLMASSVVVAIGQPLGLKVLALPKADELPYLPVASKVIKTYDEGLGFEGIAVGDDGVLYLSGNRDLDFSRADYYHKAQGELIARKPDGTEQVIFKTPRGLTSGVPVVAKDHSIYLTSHGDSSFIWQIDSSGKYRQLAQLPEGSWPNGLDLGPDGMLYSPDSFLGVIWKIDPKTGVVETAVRDQALLARAFISLAPGANGLHFKGRDMIVTVSDRTTVLRYSMDEQGKLGPARLIAKGIPGDDFAVGEDGSLFITTHPYNTIVKVTPEGKRTIIGKDAQHIIGATDAAFGKTPADKNTLYVVTDGGAFTGGPRSRGELVALQPYIK